MRARNGLYAQSGVRLGRRLARRRASRGARGSRRPRGAARPLPQLAVRAPGDCDGAEVAILVDWVERVVMRAVLDQGCRVVSLEGRLAGDLEQRNGAVGAEQSLNGVARFRPPLPEAL